MQTLAREFHLSETVFVLAATAPGANYRLRIFTPGTELPFAGHPSVGAALALLRRGTIEPGEVVQECGAGLLPVEVGANGRATLTGGTPWCGPELDPAPLLASVSLTEADLGPATPRLAGCGLRYPYLLVRAPAVARAAVGTLGADLAVFSWDESERVAHARVFCAAMGVTEDPATGSAALGLGVFLVASGLLPAAGESSFTVHQGGELHRPSILVVTVSAANGVVTRATVSGDAVAIAAGRIAVPPFVG
jgi:trans-2,3-dihydro-3-hydroxyanthranilate isomerase